MIRTGPVRASRKATAGLTRPGSSSSKPSKKLRISSRLRGQTRSYTATASARADLSGKKSVPMWEIAPHADVEELADTGFGCQEPNNPAQEAPVLHRRPAQPRHQREHLLRGDPVRLAVVLAAQQVFTYSPGIHTRSVRHRRPTPAVRCPWEGDEALKARRISSDWR